jgi:hypothetical protein
MTGSLYLATMASSCPTQVEPHAFGVTPERDVGALMPNDQLHGSQLHLALICRHLRALVERITQRVERQRRVAEAERITIAPERLGDVPRPLAVRPARGETGEQEAVRALLDATLKQPRDGLVGGDLSRTAASVLPST